MSATSGKGCEETEQDDAMDLSQSDDQLQSQSQPLCPACSNPVKKEEDDKLRSDLETCKKQLKDFKDRKEEEDKQRFELEKQLKEFKERKEEEDKLRSELETCQKQLKDLKDSQEQAVHRNQSQTLGPPCHYHPVNPGESHCYVCNCWLTSKKEEEDKLRSELEKCKKQFKDFKDRMSFEASTEVECSGRIFEDITNPCRASEIQTAYEKLEMTLCPKKQDKSKEKEGESLIEDKEQIERMIKEVFTKATNDMKKKKEELETFFNINDKQIPDTKQLQCKTMAVQSLQMLIFWQDCKHYQNTLQQLGRTPDVMSELADKCYKQGCLMALCNPPLILDWDKKNSSCFLPPILQQNDESGSGDKVTQKQPMNACGSKRV